MQKQRRLRALLNGMGSVAIGYSGGVDSTLLVKVAADVLGDRALAVIGTVRDISDTGVR